MAIRWTFRERLGAGLAAVIALVAILAVTSILAVEALGGVRDSVAFHRARELADVERLRVMAEKKVASSRAFLLTGDDQFRQETYGYRRGFLEELRWQQRQANGNGHLLDEASAAELAHHEALERAFDARSKGDFAVGYWELEVKPRRDALESALDELELDGRTRLAQAEQISEQGVQRAIRLMGLAASIALIFATTLALLLSRTLSRLYDDAQHAIRRRDEFLSVASHELKTPLTTLLMQAQLLDRTAQQAESVPAEDVRRRTQILSRSTMRLKHLLDDVLEFTRVREGQLALRIEQVDLCGLVQKVIGRFERDRPEAHGAIRMEADGPVLGAWDPLRLEVAVGSLIGNALDHGRPPIRVVVRRVDEHAEVEVCDHGLGVAEGNRQRIFLPYERVRETADPGGLGLGLFLAQHIALAHGGGIRLARRQSGVGARFTLELPLEATPT